MDNNCSEKVMLLRLKEGNEETFALIYERYHHAIYRNVSRLIRDAAETEDIVQEVFLTLWKKRAGIDHEKPLGGWLFTVSYHLSIDLLKIKLRQRIYRKIAQGFDNGQADTDSPEFQLNLLEEAISQLSPQKRRVFQLCKLEGKSYEQASAELGISKYTINEYLKDGMSFIRQYIKSRVSFHLFIFLFLPGSILYALFFC